MHALVPRGGFRFLLLGHIGLLDGDDARRLRQGTRDVGIERHQHTVAHGQSAVIERLGLAQILFSRCDALERRGRGNLDLVHIASVGLDGQRVAADDGNAAQIAHHLRACAGRRCQQKYDQSYNSRHSTATGLAFTSHTISCSTTLISYSTALWALG